MQEVTAETPVTDFQQPDGVTWATVDANSGMRPSVYTRKTVREVFVNGTVPTQIDNTKMSVDIDSVTNTLWTYDCPGILQTKGFLNLSQVDSNNPNFQSYDQKWITRARRGVGVRGGPSNGATMYFYQVGFWTPYGASWGAPFPPTRSCAPAPPPDAPPSPPPDATPAPAPAQAPAPSAAVLPLVPLPMWLYRRISPAGRISGSKYR